MANTRYQGAGGCAKTNGIGFNLTTNLTSILASTRLWQPIEGSDDWQSCANSLGISAFSPTGSAGIQFNSGDDKIINGCTQQNLTLPPPSDTTDDDDGIDWGSEDPAGELFRVLCAGIVPANSWLDYRPAFEVTPIAGSVYITTLSTKPLPNPNGTLSPAAASLFGVPMDAVSGALGPLVGGTAAPGGTIQGPTPNASGAQQRTVDTFRVRFYGTTRRALYPIPVPYLSNVGGVAPTWMPDADVDYWNHYADTNMAGGVEYVAEWCQTYRVQGPFTTPIQPPPNPLIGT